MSPNGLMRKTSKQEIKALAQDLAATYPEGALVALYGELGAGKTTLAKALGAALGLSEENISSPTYTYMHLHEGFVHFDLWRLKNAEEFCALGFEEYLESPGWVVIEWPDRIEALLPSRTVRIHLC